MNPQIQALMDRITALEMKLASNDFAEFIRDIVIFDQDVVAAQSVVTSVNFGASTVTTGSVPPHTFQKFGRIYFRGQAYDVPLYSIS